ncbi:DUF2501 domain-containing protein [Burkholderia cenocepacia]|uniref:DUF2501 domain-containing protein n=1 Tax=Burkholderia cepacia complex TaxID=87882 RepID=UPI000F55A2CF|nr:MULTISPECIES: DUF2501 domain-containing protein [Burkholderia cepacia complex]ELW9446648.1 DUF2501 domain-containing protein [Burkholderia cenocepacia]MBR8483490.1 DUF2501 domain-containing protein [Burkholderia cenocepacia]MDN7466911.1 DUF2501 domain-containing protein [Burkholderia orbicola]MDN7505812.1 DUF2501 domain-containing protein [Burkholderia orbicola]RQU09579.1 DUF2501 domain-containing protein [Burkholderia cenocepacia]
MNARLYRATVAGALIGLLAPFSVAHAQLGDVLKQVGGGGDSGGSAGGALGNLGGLGGALTGSTGNVAGLLQFCIQNNYLGGATGSGASSVKDALLGKLGGTASASSDSGYTSGASGILDAGNGSKLDLSGGGLKQQVTKQICDKVLTQAKSLL